VEREDEVFIPDGNFIIQAGDRVHVASDIQTITTYFRVLGKNDLRVKNVMLLGGGRISYYLAKMIVPMGIHVTMIEINEETAQELSEALPEVNVIHGDGTDQELLDQEGLAEMDVFVALCNRDEENLMVGLYAAKSGVPKVIVKNSRMAFSDLFTDMLDSIISPKAIVSDEILRYVRAHASGEGIPVEKVYRLMNGKAEALEFIVSADAPYIGVPLRELERRDHTLIAAIVRGTRVIIPFGNDTLEAGDSVIVVAGESGISDLGEVIHP
jgi:trk system potassium uptake protein TrkA